METARPDPAVAVIDAVAATRFNGVFTRGVTVSHEGYRGIALPAGRKGSRSEAIRRSGVVASSRDRPRQVTFRPNGAGVVVIVKVGGVAA